MKLAVCGVLAAICMLGAQNARAQSDIGFKRIGASAGLVNVEDVDATVGIGVFADLGTMSPTLKLEPYLDFWSKSEDSGGAEVSVRDIAIGARGKYMFETSSSVRPFAGAGLGLHFVHAEVDVPEQNFGGFIIPALHAEDSSTKLGLDVGGGIETPLNATTDFLAQGWYTFVSDVAQLSLKVGLSWKMGS